MYGKDRKTDFISDRRIFRMQGHTRQIDEDKVYSAGRRAYPHMRSWPKRRPQSCIGWSQFSWSVRSSSGPASLFSTHIHVASAAPAPGLPQTARHPGALFLCVYSHRQETASKHYFQAECPGRSVPVFKAWSRGGRG